MSTGHAPTASELAAHPVVVAALEQAWVDSRYGDPEDRHEEGGWIYLEVGTREIRVKRAPSGIQAAIDLSSPPEWVGQVVVGKFHTQPNPISEGWMPGPSSADLRVDALHGVPDLIRSDTGVHFSGPPSRRGGLAGKPGFPLEGGDA